MTKSATYNQYMPIDPDFYQVIDKEISKSEEVKVFYFDPSHHVEEAKGRFSHIQKTADGEFLSIGEETVRLDRVITLNGKIGPAYNEYDSYANACLSCQAGYDF